MGRANATHHGQAEPVADCGAPHQERHRALPADRVRGPSHNPQRHRADGREKETGCAANQYLSAHDRPKRGKQRDQHRSCGQCSYAHAH
jgi:hypothetical protein